MSIELQTLANYGVLGVVLVWFMLREEKKSDELKKAVENNTLVLTKFCAKVGVDSE